MQYFADLQMGANVEGPIVRAALGASYGLTEDVALRAMASQTVGKKEYVSTNVELGLTYRFSIPRF